jgi:hypothetical protein
MLALAALDRLCEALMAILHLAPHHVTENEVLRAQAAYFALMRAAREDARLLGDPAHQAATEEARAKFLRLFGEWAG